MASSRSLGQLTLDLVARTSNFTAALDKAARDADARLAKIEKSAKVVGAAIGVAVVAVGAALANMVSNTINAMDELSKLAQSTGVAVEELSALTYAADLSGVSQDQLGTALVRLTKNMSDAAQGTGEAQKGFDALGISVKNAEGGLKTSSQVLTEVSAKFAQYEDGAEKTALAVNLFGRSGADLIPLLNAGADGLQEMTDQARELGLTFDNETGRAAEAFNDNLSRLSAVKQGLVTRITAELLPSLENLSERLFNSAKSAENLDRVARIASTGVKLLATAGVIVTGVFNALGQALGGVGATIVQLVQGNFAEAFEIANGATTDFFDNFNGTVGAVAAIWDETSSGITADADDNAAKIAAPVIQAEDKVKRAGRKIVDEAARIYKRVEEQIARIQRDVETFFLTDEQLALFDLRTDGADPEQLARAERLLEIRKNLRTEEEARQNLIKQEERQQSVLDDLNMEIEALGKSAEWIATRNALIDAGVTAESDMGRAISETVRQLYAQGKAIDDQIELMDTFRSESSNALADVVSGTKSLKEAFTDLVDSIYDRITKMVADNIIEQMLGQSGTTQTGSQGGWLSGLIGAFFGGGRATGGSVSAGKFYEVGENDSPELLMAGGRQYLIPGNNGTVKPMGGGGGVSVTQNFINPQMRDPRSESQRQQQAAQKLRQSTRNS